MFTILIKGDGLLFEKEVTERIMMDVMRLLIRSDNKQNKPPLSTAQVVMEVMKDGNQMNWSTIRDRVKDSGGFSNVSIQQALGRLMRNGIVQRHRRGVYSMSLIGVDNG